METTNATEKPVLTKPVFITLKELKPGTHVNMHVKVESVKVIRERRRYDSNSLSRVAECLVGDETGCVTLMAYDDQLNIVKEGACITIRNVHANVVKEHLRLEIDKWAKVEAGLVNVKSVNQSVNASTVEYELVTVTHK
jgi:replication factor A1